ncbi:Gx transporter family protein [Alkalithermobacter paradoxus]|uniref:Heptaprenyl diphosphate synthase component I n=1 Tax=Alkalithermobacter paradoxus TaxID=29349 RepID=A0A1V4I8T5_9FIRM|nr:heptaprenyl diphosphate synthase component I [[Clostridium] thermoalcaliphilum]
MSKTRKLVIIAIFVSQAMALHIIESSIPNPLIAISPGAKLGLSNIITLTSLKIFGFKESLLILVLRIALSTLWGSMSSFLFSLVGGVLSLVAMATLLKLLKERLSIIGVSIVGAIFHNIGQLLVASIVIQNINIFIYLPVLLLSSIPTGLFIGIVCKFLVKTYKYSMKMFS